MKFISRFIRDERGSTALEYGLIAALVVVVIIGGITSVGNGVSSTWNSVSNAITE